MTKTDIEYGSNDLIPEDLDLKAGTLKKTVYLDTDVYRALLDEAKRRGQKKAMPLINQILRESLLSSDRTMEERLRLLEDKVFG